jgi:UDP-N-acetylglucosamine acyltransferase
MAQVHIAHDSQVGSHTIFANSAGLAGHVEVQDYATVGAYSAVHQFCRVGTHAFMGGATVATRDVLPYSLTVGNRAYLYGANVVGLRRRGFSAEAIAALRRAFRALSQPGQTPARAIEELRAVGPLTPEVETLVAFVQSAKRGIVHARRRGAAVADDSEP